MGATSTYMTFLMHKDPYTNPNNEFVKSYIGTLEKLKDSLLKCDTKDDSNKNTNVGLIERNYIAPLINVLKGEKITGVSDENNTPHDLQIVLTEENTGKNVNWSKLVDITEFPDLGTDPEILETTTLSDNMQTFIMGIHGNESLVFNANYDFKTYQNIKALELKDRLYAVWIGGEKDSEGKLVPTGSSGKYMFHGQLSVRVTGGGVNEILGMSISIAPSTVITLDYEKTKIDK